MKHIDFGMHSRTPLKDSALVAAGSMWNPAIWRLWLRVGQEPVYSLRVCEMISLVLRALSHVRPSTEAHYQY
jgi:hypothetical protein